MTMTKLDFERKYRTKQNTETCEACRFWLADQNESTNAGSCRRHPPSLVQIAPPHAFCQSVFPTTVRYGWCGEYQSIVVVKPVAKKPALRRKPKKKTK